MRTFAAAMALLVLAGCTHGTPSADDPGPAGKAGLPSYLCGPEAAPRGGDVCLAQAESNSATTAHEVTALARDMESGRLHMAVRDTGPTSRSTETDGGASYPTFAHLLLGTDGGQTWSRIEGPSWAPPEGLPTTATRTSQTFHSLVPDGRGGVHVVGSATYVTGTAVAAPLLRDDAQYAFHGHLNAQGDWSAPTYWAMAPGAPPPSLVAMGPTLVAFLVDGFGLVRAATSTDGGLAWTRQSDDERADCIYPANAVVLAGVAVLACFDFEGSSPSYAFDAATRTYRRLGSIPTDEVTGFANSPTAASFGLAGLVLALDATDAWYTSLDSGQTWTQGFDLSTAAPLQGLHPSGFGAMSGDSEGRLHLMVQASGDEDVPGLTTESLRVHFVLDLPAKSIVAGYVLERAPPAASDPAGLAETSATVYVSASAPAFALGPTEGLVAFTSNEDAVVARFAWA